MRTMAELAEHYARVANAHCHFDYAFLAHDDVARETILSDLRDEWRELLAREMLNGLDIND